MRLSSIRQLTGCLSASVIFTLLMAGCSSHPPSRELRAAVTLDVDLSHATDIEPPNPARIPPPCSDSLMDSAREAAYSLYRKAESLIPRKDGDEADVGREIQGSIQQEFHGRIDQDPVLAGYVKKLGRHLSRHVRRTDVAYHFHVIDGPDETAFSIPGGGVYVYTGLLGKLRNEAQLAAVLAHEIQHVDLGHCMDAYRIATSLPEKLQNRAVTTAAVFVGRLMKHPFSSAAELEADRRAVDLVSTAGYSPYQYAEFWEQCGYDRCDDGTPARDAGTGNGDTGDIEAVRAKVNAIYRTLFDRHPANTVRGCVVRTQIGRLAAESRQSVLYVGVRNFRERVPMFEKVY